MTAMDGSHTQYQPDLDAARGEEGEGEEDMLYTDLFNGEGNKESRARWAEDASPRQRDSV